MMKEFEKEKERKLEWKVEEWKRTCEEKKEEIEGEIV